MTKPLSEQVAELQELFDRVALECDQRGETIAELEAHQHHLWDVKEAIRVENFELWSKNERLEAECDDLYRLVQEARDENAALRAGQGWWWPKKADDFPCCTSTVPRVITADELQSGAKVATFTDQGRPVAGTVTGEATGKVTLLLHNDNIKGFDTERTFILLEDAPQPTGYADDDHQDAEARQDGHVKPVDTTPATCKEKGENFTRPTRLSVHALNVAPVGSVHALNVAPVGSVVQNAGGLGWTKTERGKWTGALGLQKWSSTELLAIADSDATITYPGQS